MKLDFEHEFNHEGTWCDALVRHIEDDNNAAFWAIDPSNGSVFDTGVCSRGEDAGNFREKK